MGESYQAAKKEAAKFITDFARENEFFCGGDVLEAFRASGRPFADLDWRNRWGGLISAANKSGVLARAGRVAPTSKQSHTEFLTLWRSRLYKGPQSLTHKEQAGQLVADLRKKVLCREVTIEAALWSMYDRGWLDRGNSPEGA